MGRQRDLVTERLHLRDLVASDRAFVKALLTDDDVRRFLGGPIPAARLESAVSAYFVSRNEAMAWLVESKDTRQLLGLISISDHVDGRNFELSYQFRTESWGSGFATEAAKRILQYAQEDLQLDRLIAETQAANTASRRLLERIGMKEARRLYRFGAEQVIYAR